MFRSPSHGRLDVLTPDRLVVQRSNASFFTSEEVGQERLVYQHDDSGMN